MLSALDSGSGGPGSSPDRGTAFRSLVPLFTQVYKWVPANLRKFNQSLHATETGISSGLMGP